jgi:hypothetical protein
VVPQDIGDGPEDEEIVYDSMDPEAPKVLARVCEGGCVCVHCAHYALYARAYIHIVTCTYTDAHAQNTHM